MDIVLPFKVGDVAESRSFSPGFKGAWFRSKISDMYIRQGHLECLLEYTDFPDEKKTWTRLYKIPPGCRKQKSSERMIMLRPTFPLWYWKNQLPETLPKTDVVAVVSGPWKTGDLIEWFYTDCYWTGKIIEVLSDDKVKIVLPEPPVGEGGFYVADCKDLRPALDWSLEKGWSVPLSQEDDKCWYTAYLISQITDTESSSSDEDSGQSCNDKEYVQKCTHGASEMPLEVDSDSKLAANNNGKSSVKNQIDHKEEELIFLNGASDMPSEVTNSKEKHLPDQNSKCCMDTDTKDSIAKPDESPEALSDAQSSPICHNRRKTSTEHAFVESHAGTIDDAIMDLEKLAHKIRQLENLLISVGSAPSNVTDYPWKIAGKGASEKHK
ncbi:hypothetical protein ACP4OV_022209 [Aristida adscensionis]